MRTKPAYCVIPNGAQWSEESRPERLYHNRTRAADPESGSALYLLRRDSQDFEVATT
jgi:hypothetical protein